MDSKVRELRLEQIHESPLNPRRLFDPLKLEELKASIKKHGILEPLVVRQVGGRYELIAGARRLRAAQYARLQTVPVVVRRATDEEAVELMLVENLQRAELEALDECEAYHRLVDKKGYTQRRIAQVIGKSEFYVCRVMGLRNLAPEARKALVGGRIAASTAMEMATASMGQQRAVLKATRGEQNQFGYQVGVGEVKQLLRPDKATRSKHLGKCWRCHKKLTVAEGARRPGCEPCTEEFAELQGEVRELRRKLREAAA